MSDRFETTFVANPVQKQFIESRATADLFAARMGEGKSVALAWAALTYTRFNPGARVCIIRDTFENLQATTMKTFFEWFPPGIAGEYNGSQKTFTWASGIAKGEVVFLGMEDPQDASKLQSREYGMFCMDEPAPAVGQAGINEMIFDIAMTRLRQRDMNYYCAKLAENNPDELHWTYRKFVQPGMPGFALWQSAKPENVENLPADYYQNLRRQLAHRPDLVRRFVDGDFGFQSEGKAVTPEWDDKIHLANGLIPMPRRELILLWDFGHNPTCIVTQKTPMGEWLVLDAFVGEDIGTEELIMDAVRPLLAVKYKGHPFRHIGDPAGTQRDQSSIMRSPVAVIRRELGGTWRPGPIKPIDRIEPLRAILRKQTHGHGYVRVDRDNAKPVWQALRGGWHYHVARTGIVSSQPKKNMHSHPGDAMGYGAAILFPLGRMQGHSRVSVSEASYFGSGPQQAWRIGPKIAGSVPAHGERLPAK